MLSGREEVEDAFRRLNDDSEIGMGWNGRNQNFTVCFFLIEREFIVDFMVRKFDIFRINSYGNQIVILYWVRFNSNMKILVSSNFVRSLEPV